MAKVHRLQLEGNPDGRRVWSKFVTHIQYSGALDNTDGTIHEQLAIVDSELAKFNGVCHRRITRDDGWDTHLSFDTLEDLVTFTVTWS